jgi:transposase
MSFQPRPDLSIPEETNRVARAAFPKGNPYMKLRDELGVLYADDKFIELFSKVGQPGEAPGLLAMVTVFQFMEGVSDRQAADSVRGRIDWKYALGLELTYAGFDYSILCEFRQRLIEGGLEQQLLNELLQVCEAKGMLKKRGRQRSDSTHVLSAVRDLNRLEMVGETLRYALNAISSVDPDWTRRKIHPDWYKKYPVRFEAYRLPKSETERAELGVAIGADGYKLLEIMYSADTPEEIRAQEAVEILRCVWIQQYYMKDGQVCWRESGNLPPGELLIRSPYDPEARYSQKRQTGWTGYKVHLTETCDQNLPALITNVETTAATTPDVSTTEKIHASLSAKNLLPREHFLDAGYIDADLIVTSQETHGVDLIGPVPSDTTWQGRTAAGFEVACFHIDWEQQFVICPQGHKSQIWSESHDSYDNPVIHVQFVPENCQHCSCRSNCTRSQNGLRALKLRTQKQHEALQQARTRQKTDEFKQLYKKRAGVEGTISQGTRTYDLRSSRYIGQAKTHLQNIISAVAMDLVRLAHWFNNIQPAKTRTSSFAALAPC